MTRTGQGELPSHLLHLATLQLLCRAAPFTHAKSIPLHTLSDLAADYICLLAVTAKSNAELAGRSKASVWDVGRAFDEFGTGSLAELRDELEKGGGETEEATRLRDLADGLKEALDVPAPPQPIARFTYDPLTPAELAALAEIQEMEAPPLDPPPARDGETSGSSDEEEDAVYQSPPSSTAPSPPLLDQVKDEEAQFDFSLAVLAADEGHDTMGNLQEEENEEPVSAWRDPSLIPAYVPEFLPPFPGMERESDLPEHVRRRRDREREREAAAASSAWEDGGDGAREEPHNIASGSDRDPWMVAVPYDNSIIDQQNPSRNLPTLSPPSSPSTSSRRRRRSLSPPALTSLPSYRFTAGELAKEDHRTFADGSIGKIDREINPLPALRANTRRRTAAATISMTADVSLYNDSLFGNVPVPLVRNAALISGFLPELAPPKVHPFNTNLPHTIATPIPAHPSPNASLLAPLSHPRIPSLIGKMASSLSSPQLGDPESSQLLLFNRLTRMGPPGPLGSKGEALDYEYVGQTSLIAVNVDWPTREFHQPLLTRERDDGTETGIKLTLGRSQTARTNGAGSPAAGALGFTPGFTPGYSGFTPGPSGFTPGPSGATPGPSWLARSTSPPALGVFTGSPSQMSPVIDGGDPFARIGGGSEVGQEEEQGGVQGTVDPELEKSNGLEGMEEKPQIEEEGTALQDVQMEALSQEKNWWD